MSASEKLKALQVLPAPPYEPEGKLYYALPQIVAVVEAAEELRGDIPWTAKEKLDAALSALDEALSETMR